MSDTTEDELTFASLLDDLGKSRAVHPTAGDERPAFTVGTIP